MEKKTVTLKYPFTREGEEPITELHFREPLGKEIKQMQKFPTEPLTGIIFVAAKLCEEGLSPEEIEGLCATDYMNIADTLGEWVAPNGMPFGASLPIAQ